MRSSGIEKSSHSRPMCFGASRIPVAANSWERKSSCSISRRIYLLPLHWAATAACTKESLFPFLAGEKLHMQITRTCGITRALFFWRVVGNDASERTRERHKRWIYICAWRGKGAPRCSLAATAERAAKGKKRETSKQRVRGAMTGCSRDSMLVVSCVCARYGLQEVLEKKIDDVALGPKFLSHAAIKPSTSSSIQDA